MNRTWVSCVSTYKAPGGAGSISAKENCRTILTFLGRSGNDCMPEVPASCPSLCINATKDHSMTGIHSRSCSVLTHSLATSEKRKTAAETKPLLPLGFGCLKKTHCQSKKNLRLTHIRSLPRMGSLHECHILQNILVSGSHEIKHNKQKDPEIRQTTGRIHRI